MLKEKEPLYRKVNTRARGVHHDFGGDYKNDRNTKAENENEQVKARSAPEKATHEVAFLL